MKFLWVLFPRTQGCNLWLFCHDCSSSPSHFWENYFVHSLIPCTVKIQSIIHLLKFSTSLCSNLGLLLESLAFSIVYLPGLMMPLGQVLVWQNAEGNTWHCSNSSLNQPAFLTAENTLMTSSFSPSWDC